MHRPDLHLNLYANGPEDIDRVAMPDLTMRLMLMFRESAAKQGLTLSLRRKEWPQPVYTPGESGLIDTKKAGSYAHLAAPGHAADAAVLLVQNLDAIGPETAELLRRRRSDLYHVFVVTLDALPDRRTNRGLYRGINTVPLTERPTEFDGILEPMPIPEAIGRGFDVEAQGLLSYHEYGTLRTAGRTREVAERLESVRMLKEINGAA